MTEDRERAHMKKSQVSNWGFSEHLSVLPKKLPEVVKEQAKQAGIDGYCNIPELEKRMLSVWEAARCEERKRTDEARKLLREFLDKSPVLALRPLIGKALVILEDLRGNSHVQDQDSGEKSK